MTDIKDLEGYVISHIDEAIEKENIKICYQPIIRSLTGNICGKEALARWESPEYGLLMPEDFLPILEEHRLIHKLDCFMISRICSHYNHCLQRHDPLLPISFNLSWLDFELCYIIGVLNEETEKNRVPREMLRVEINESVLSHSNDFIKSKLLKLHEEGYEIIVDDFGSGHSSINILKDYSFDELKIDLELLWDGGERSKTIIESLCSLAKSLGISTIAEGVETKEQESFLNTAGFEKMQGHLFTAPMFYWELMSYIKDSGLSFEPLNLRDYYDTLGKWDVGKKSSIPYAIAESDNGILHFLYTNQEFMKNIQSLDIESFKGLEDIINDASYPPGQKILQLVKKAGKNKEPQAMDFILKGNYCIARVGFLAGASGKTAVEAEFHNLSMDKNVNHMERINDALEGVYSVFDRVVGFDLDMDRLWILYKETGFTERYEGNSFSENREKYINSEIYPEDRQRYSQFIDFRNAKKRILSSGRNYISGCFRFKTANGNYIWREQYIVLSRGGESGHRFLLCTKEVDEKQLALILQLSSFIDSGASGGFDGQDISDSVLWKSIVESCPVGLFWKDRNRRFLGVNKAFLDYYGFESEDAVLGKTDEEMNWHVDPYPFKTDEEDIINTGAVIKDVRGKCICRGENRDILVNKAPILKDGKIVGLIGFFRDITKRLIQYDYIKEESFTDPVTGVLNIKGLMDSVSRFINAYDDNKCDFALIAVNINRYDEMKESFGEDHLNRLMRLTADRIKAILGNTSVIARSAKDLFIVLKQVEKNEEGSSLMQNISNEIRYLREVDGIPCTIYTSAGYAVFSESRDPESLYSLAVKRMNDQMERIRRFTGGF